MNKAEPICRSYGEKISCFNSSDEIPDEFVSSGDNNIDCSFVFPPGYSLYIEEFYFVNNDFGRDNFVLLNDEPLIYHSQLNWEIRRQNFWETLEKNHPLRDKSVINRRSIVCVKTLKLHAKKVKFAMKIQRSPICEDERHETALLDQFYVETDSEFKNKYLPLNFFIFKFYIKFQDK